MYENTTNICYLYQAINKHNKIARDHKPTAEEQVSFLSSLNSYLGIMKHYKTYKIRQKMLSNNISGWWLNYFYIGNNFKKLEKKQKRVKSFNPFSGLLFR